MSGYNYLPGRSVGPYPYRGHLADEWYLCRADDAPDSFHSDLKALGCEGERIAELVYQTEDYPDRVPRITCSWSRRRG